MGEYQRIQNFPQHGLQLVAEVGGILALFLGISIISILECFCYLFYGLKKCCCSCFSDESDEDDNDAVEPLGIRRQQNWNRQSQAANQASRLNFQNPAATDQLHNGYASDHSYHNQNDYVNNGNRKRPNLSLFGEREERD